MNAASRCSPKASLYLFWGEFPEAAWQLTHHRDLSTPRLAAHKEKIVPRRCAQDDKCEEHGPDRVQRRRMPVTLTSSCSPCLIFMRLPGYIENALMGLCLLNILQALRIAATHFLRVSVPPWWICFFQISAWLITQSQIRL